MDNLDFSNPEILKLLEAQMYEGFYHLTKGRLIFPVYRGSRSMEKENIGEANLSHFSKTKPIPNNIPVLNRSFVYNEETFEKDFKENIRLLAELEDRLLFSGETKGWGALGIEGLSTATGRCSISASGKYPANILSDIIEAKKHLPDNETLVLIAPKIIATSLNAILWRDEEHEQPPITYRRFLIEEDIISVIIETDCLYSKEGKNDSILLVVPGEDNFYAVSDFQLEANVWLGETPTITFRETIIPVIKKPESIVEIKNIIV